VVPRLLVLALIVLPGTVLYACGVGSSASHIRTIVPNGDADRGDAMCMIGYAKTLPQSSIYRRGVS